MYREEDLYALSPDRRRSRVSVPNQQYTNRRMAVECFAVIQTIGWLLKRACGNKKALYHRVSSATPMAAALMTLIDDGLFCFFVLASVDGRLPFHLRPSFIGTASGR